MRQLTKQLQLTEEHLDLMWAVTEKVRSLLMLRAAGWVTCPALATQYGRFRPPMGAQC